MAHIRIGSRPGLDMNSDCVLVAAHERIGQRIGSWLVSNKFVDFTELIEWYEGLVLEHIVLLNRMEFKQFAIVFFVPIEVLIL